MKTAIINHLKMAETRVYVRIIYNLTRSLKKTCFYITACDEGPGICAHLLTFFSILLVFITIPFSLCFAVKVCEFGFYTSTHVAFLIKSI